MKRYLLHYFYRQEGGGGVFPYILTEREKMLIEKLQETLYGFNQEIEFVELEQIEKEQEDSNDR